MKAIEIQEFGGPEVLVLRDTVRPGVESGHVIVKVHTAGINFIDVYHRTGFYKNPLPLIPGMEGSGVIEEIGDGVEGFSVGDRVAWSMSPGAYAEYAKVPARVLSKVPNFIGLDQAAAVLLQGLTAHYLVRSTFELKPGQTAVVHAAAGGVGLLLVQMAKAIGATIIATTSTEEKASLVKAAGADHVLLYEGGDLAARVRECNGGSGVDVVYDSVGASTFASSLKSLKPRGMLVTFGQSSGPVTPLSPLELSGNGSLYLTRPNLAHYMQTREEVDWRSKELFDSVASGKLQVRIDSTYPLSEAAAAHAALESRATAGKLILRVGD